MALWYGREKIEREVIGGVSEREAKTRTRTEPGLLLRRFEFVPLTSMFTRYPPALNVHTAYCDQLRCSLSVQRDPNSRVTNPNNPIRIDLISLVELPLLLQSLDQSSVSDPLESTETVLRLNGEVGTEKRNQEVSPERGGRRRGRAH